MGAKKHLTSIDGHSYALTPLGGFDSLRFLRRAGQLAGPFLRALAVSDDGKEFIVQLLASSEGFEDLLDGNASDLVGLVGLTIDQVIQAMDEDSLVQTAALLMVGHLWTHEPGLEDSEMVRVETGEAYDRILSHRVRSAGPMHQLKLLWWAIRCNLGPTSAVQPTSGPGAATE